MNNKETKLFTAREIASGINNALLQASRPEGTVILESRMRKLSEYSAAVVAPCMRHTSMGLLSTEELVVSLLAAALLVQAGSYTGGEKLPLVSLAKAFTKKESK